MSTIRSRSRSRSSRSWYSYPWRSTNPSEHYGTAPGTLNTSNAYDEVEEFIVSEVSSKGNRGFHPCSHYKIERQVVSDYILGFGNAWYNTSNHSLGYWLGSKAETSKYWDGSRYSLQPGYPGSGASTLGAWLEPPTAVAPMLADVPSRKMFLFKDSSAIEELRYLAVKAMTPKIQGDGSSIAEDIIQAKQITTLLGSATRLKGFFQWVRAIGPKGRYTLKEFSKVASDLWLQYSFNVAPIYRDLVLVSQAVRDVKKKLNWLRNNEGRILTGRYRRFLNDSYADIDMSTSGFSLPTNFVSSTAGAKCLVTYTTRVYHATMKYRFITDLIGRGDTTRAFLDMVGLNLNPAHLWNVTPWTFVLDWFWNVSSWLDQFKKTEVDILLLPMQFCDSIHVIRQTFAYVKEQNIDMSAFNVFEDAYERQVIDILGVQRAAPLKWGGGLNLLRSSLLAAIGITRLR